MSTSAPSPLTLESALALIAQQQGEIARLQQSHESWMRAVAHDMRAPLRHIVSFAPLLQETVQELVTAAPQAQDAGQDALEFAATMEQAARKMSAMLEGMGQVSRAARMPLQMTCVNWHTVIQHVVEQLQAQHPLVRWELPQLAATVMADAQALHAITQALLENAVKFSARQPQPTVRLEIAASPQGGWRWIVQDNGAGFEGARSASLGALFQRMHRDSEFDGVGCGLALVSTLVQRHGGQWKAHGQVEQGCCVWVDLPHAVQPA